MLTLLTRYWSGRSVTYWRKYSQSSIDNRKIWNVSWTLPENFQFTPSLLNSANLRLVGRKLRNVIQEFEWFETANLVALILLVLAIDSLIVDDEPIWEPIEWSLLQTWLFFTFLFAWIGEVLIGSRFGGYTGRDKRVWFAWYKAFWLIEGWYLISYAMAFFFVITPFYYEITYTVPMIVSWWDWYSREFIVKFLFINAFILSFGTWLQMRITFINWRWALLGFVLIEILLSVLFYWQFIITFWGYFTSPLWYQQTRINDHIQLSSEPSKWGWGAAKRDHFTYHKTSTVFWFKNDGPFASSMLLLNLFFLMSLFFVNIFWLALIRRVIALREVPVTFFTFSLSMLRQLNSTFLMIFVLVIFSFLVGYWRFPIEFFWIMSETRWVTHFYIWVDVIKTFF